MKVLFKYFYFFRFEVRTHFGLSFKKNDFVECRPTFLSHFAENEVQYYARNCTSTIYVKKHTYYISSANIYLRTFSPLLVLRDARTHEVVRAYVRRIKGSDAPEKADVFLIQASNWSFNLDHTAQFV